MHTNAVAKGDQVVLLDDLMATGGTVLATCDLIEKLGGEIAGSGFTVDLPFLDGSKKMRERGYDVFSLASYDSE